MIRFILPEGKYVVNSSFDKRDKYGNILPSRISDCAIAMGGHVSFRHVEGDES